MDAIEQFRKERARRIAGNAKDARLLEASRSFLLESIRAAYSYNFDWLSRPIIQYPQDIVAMQELIWAVRPDLVIETGIAHGGSIIMSASMLAMLDYCDALESGEQLDPRMTRRRVLAIDVDIRSHQRAAIAAHPMSHRIDMIEGSSIAADIVAQAQERASGYQRTLICLDSNHTHEHVLAELEAYAPLTSVGSYCVVFDTVIADLPQEFFPHRPWGKGNNPKTAVHEYLRRLRHEGRKAADGAALTLEIDKTIDNKLLITVAPDGYLRRT